MAVDLTPEHTDAQISASRTRMVFGHVPAASITAAGMAVIVTGMSELETGQGTRTITLIWLVTNLLLAFGRAGHAISYLRSSNRAARHWRPSFLLITLAFGWSWAASLWMLPLEGHLGLCLAMSGAITGMAASGASFLNVDRVAVRYWITPLLVSSLIFSVRIEGMLGWFNAATVLGFLIILWNQAERAHRRITELLRLRYRSEEVAQAREQALAEAEQLSSAKGRFLATMSHEMRTPLHGILGLSRMLRGDLIDHKSHHHLTLLQGAGQHLLGVINDVLDFSRLQEGMLTLQPRPVHLHALATEVCSLVDVNAAEKSLEVTLEFDFPVDQWVQVDDDRLRQVLFNLLGNAVKFTDHGKITLRVRACGQPDGAAGTVDVLFEVQDTGIGISEAELSRIFDAFHQADSGAERRTSGAGLGLSIARQICQAMQGDLLCDSTPGQGSTFRFTLRLALAEPLVDQRSQVGHDSPAAALAGTVLLVEDDPVNVLVARAELEHWGLSVATAGNGSEAIEWLTHQNADLVLMDCHMPGMDGFEATRRIRRLREAQGAREFLPIVALTASQQEQVRRQCLEAGMNGVMTKPFSPEDMRQLLERYLRRGDRTPRSTSTSRRGAAAAWSNP